MAPHLCGFVLLLLFFFLKKKRNISNSAFAVPLKFKTHRPKVKVKTRLLTGVMMILLNTSFENVLENKMNAKENGPSLKLARLKFDL